MCKIMIIPKCEEWKHNCIDDEPKNIQKAYIYLKQKWDKKEYIKISTESIPNTNYYYYYFEEKLEELDENFSHIKLKETEDIFDFFIEKYAKDNIKVLGYLVQWYIDILTIEGRDDKSNEIIDWYIEENILQNDIFLKELYVVGKRLTAESYVPPKFFRYIFSISALLTSYGKKFEKEIYDILEECLERDFLESGLNYIFKFYTYEKYDDYTYISSWYYPELTKKIKVRKNILFRKRCNHKELKTLVRKAEDILRKRNELPIVGKGWLNESVLYEAIKYCFEDITINQHASPNFLERQHYDIYIPEYKIAIEYHGEQHFHPVEFFGGETGYKKTIERDKRKEQISKENNVDLIIITEGYDINELVKKISNKIEYKETTVKKISENKIQEIRNNLTSSPEKLVAMRNISLKKQQLTLREKRKYLQLENKILYSYIDQIKFWAFRVKHCKKIDLSEKEIQKEYNEFEEVEKYNNEKIGVRLLLKKYDSINDVVSSPEYNNSIIDHIYYSRRAYRNYINYYISLKKYTHAVSILEQAEYSLMYASETSKIKNKLLKFLNEQSEEM